MQIEAKDVSARFGRNIIQRKINFTVCSGEMVGLIGPMDRARQHCCVFLQICAQWGLRFLWWSIGAGYWPAATCTKDCLSAQGGDVHWQMRVETLIELGRLPYRRPMQRITAEDRAAVDRAIAACDVGAFRQRSVAEVSGGERLRILLARALVVDGDLLLADEPISALDPLHQLQVMQLLRKTTHRSKGVSLCCTILHSPHAFATG
jgi:iron complex transport system ATP-binding protein